MKSQQEIMRVQIPLCVVFYGLTFDRYLSPLSRSSLLLHRLCKQEHGWDLLVERQGDQHD